jgi:hypothetical protein
VIKRGVFEASETVQRTGYHTSCVHYGRILYESVVHGKQNEQCHLNNYFKRQLVEQPKNTKKRRFDTKTKAIEREIENKM